MKKFLNSTSSPQRGQALVSGLILLLFTLLFCFYFLFVSESFLRGFSNTRKSRNALLKKTAAVANVMNEISLNNQNIIASLGLAQNSFAQAGELGLYIAYSQSYWETYKFLNHDKTILSSQNEKVVSFAYKAFRLSSGRGLFLAKSLSEKNKKLIASLPQKIGNFFVQASNADTFCFALQAQKKYYQNPGFYHFKILEHLYSFYFTKKDCTLTHTSLLAKVLNFRLPKLFDSSSDLVIDYKDFDVLLKQVSYGISYVDPTKAAQFLSVLNFENEETVQGNPKFTRILGFLYELPYFKDFPYQFSQLSSGLPKNITSRVTHPLFKCSQQGNWQGDFLNEEDFRNVKNCQFLKGLFLKAFFKPHWTPLISLEEFKNEKTNRSVSH